MATDVRPPEQQGLGTLASGIIEDAQSLVRQEVSLVRAELQQEWDKLKAASVMLSIGGAVATIAVIMLCLMGVHALRELAHFPEWAAYATVGGALAVLGTVLLAVGVTQIKAISFVPRRAIETLAGDT
jgi:Putative Actinobacterial Holin-X, holin superfamily III